MSFRALTSSCGVFGFREKRNDMMTMQLHYYACKLKVQMREGVSSEVVKWCRTTAKVTMKVKGKW